MAKSTIIINVETSLLTSDAAHLSIIDPSGNQKDFFYYNKCENFDTYYKVHEYQDPEVGFTRVPAKQPILEYPGIYRD